MLPKVDDRHGLPSTFKNYHCHCRRCRSAWSLYWRQWLHADPARYERERKRRRERYLRDKSHGKVAA